MTEWMLRSTEERFPELAREIADVVPIIYGIGDPDVLNEPCISVIGARRATPYGLAVAQMVGRIAAESGIVVVSGGARGCDYAAGRAALDAGGKTVVVSGCGADLVYPKSSRDLFEEAKAGKGCVVSLEDWGTPGLRHTFPKRNNLIAALSTSLVVVEAGLPSGTFGTARAARDLGRNIYAIPGSIFSAGSRGANSLIESGALIIIDEASLELRLSMDYGTLHLHTQKEKRNHAPILDALIASPCRPEDLAGAFREDLMTILRNLAHYEALGLVRRMSDGTWSATEAAYLSCAG